MTERWAAIVGQRCDLSVEIDLIASRAEARTPATIADEIVAGGDERAFAIRSQPPCAVACNQAVAEEHGAVQPKNPAALDCGSVIGDGAVGDIQSAGLDEDATAKTLVDGGAVERARRCC
jgi:hypothetical protein